MTEQLLGSLGLSFLAAFALFAVWWQNARAEAMLERWCRETGFELLDRRYCWIPAAPYALAPLHGQWVYRITIRNRAGRVRAGTVLCGSEILGVLAERVDVRWDA